ncbi:MAG: hypothetical protein QXW31_00930 [Nitrososphaerota archaeon]
MSLLQIRAIGEYGDSIPESISQSILTHLKASRNKRNLLKNKIDTRKTI